MTKARATAAIMMLAMLAVAPLLVAPLGAQQLSDRAKQIGGKFMCMCTCSQVRCRAFIFSWAPEWSFS